MSVIDLMLTCEAVEDHPHGCEETIMVELDDGVGIEGEAVTVDVTVALADLDEWGWAVEYERGCPRLRCPKHAPDPPPLDDSEVEFADAEGAGFRSARVTATHTPTGLKTSAFSVDGPKAAGRLARKQLAYVVARRGTAKDAAA